MGIEEVRKAHEEHKLATLVEGGEVPLLLSQLEFVGSETSKIFEEVSSSVKVFSPFNPYFLFLFSFFLFSFSLILFHKPFLRDSSI